MCSSSCNFTVPTVTSWLRVSVRDMRLTIGEKGERWIVINPFDKCLGRNCIFPAFPRTTVHSTYNSFRRENLSVLCRQTKKNKLLWTSSSRRHCRSTAGTEDLREHGPLLLERLQTVFAILVVIFDSQLGHVPLSLKGRPSWDAE